MSHSGRGQRWVSSGTESGVSHQWNSPSTIPDLQNPNSWGQDPETYLLTGTQADSKVCSNLRAQHTWSQSHAALRMALVFFSKKLSGNARFSLSLDPKLTLETPNTFFLDQPSLTAWSCFLWQANASFAKTDSKQIPAIWKESQSKMTGPWLKGLS